MRSIWAVAANTIKQALRLKIAAVFIVLLIVLLGVMGITMTGDGTLKGRLQTFVSYGLSLTSFLLCLLTIVVSIYSLTSDFEQRQIYTVLTKPVRRFQLLLGKLVGVVLLDVVMLGLFSAIIYTITVYTPKFYNASEVELSRLDNEFFTARASLKPAPVDVRKEVRNSYKKLRKSGQLPSGVLRDRAAHDKFIAWLGKQEQLAKRAAGPGHDLLWEFYGVKPIDPNQSLFVRFKYDVSVNPPDLQVYGRWFVGDDRQYPPDGQIFTRRDLIRTFYEIEAPADVVAKDGYLAVGFFNDPRLNNTVVIFPPEDGLEVLYKADTFTGNFIRATLLVLLRLIFLACLGILTSTFLSFPVAILACLAIFFTGMVSGFIVSSFDYLSEGLSGVYSYAIRPIIQLLPRFDKFTPAKFLVPARLLSWSLLARAAGLMICIKAVLLLLLALLIFSFREIAKIII